MSPVEIAELISVLRAQGVTHFKQGDFEVTLGPIATTKVPLKLMPTSLEKPPAEPDHQIPGVVHEMRTVFSMKDEDLVEKLFPIPKEDESS